MFWVIPAKNPSLYQYVANVVRGYCEIVRTQELNPAAAAVVVAVAGDIIEREIRAKPKIHPLNPQTVAVLPLHNQSGDQEQEYFCEGITDDIIHALSRIPGLNVIGHTSVFA